MDNKKIGNTIYNLRKRLNLTQSELASKIFVSNKAISRWETGEGIPDISNLNELSKLFNVTIDYIVKGQGADGVDLESEKQSNNDNVKNKKVEIPTPENVEKDNKTNKKNAVESSLAQTEKENNINKIIAEAENRINLKENNQNKIGSNSNKMAKSKSGKGVGVAIATMVFGALIILSSGITSYSANANLISLMVLALLLVASLTTAVVGFSINEKGTTARLLFGIGMLLNIFAIVINVFSYLIIYSVYNSMWF